MKKILRIILLGILMLCFPALIFARGRNNYHKSQPKPTPPPITKPVPPPIPTTGITLGAFQANAGTVDVEFMGWNDAVPTSSKQLFIYWENYGVSLDSIISGSQDSVIRNFAATVKAGTIKVIWAWTMNNSDYPSVAGNNPANYWPGSSYVDIIGEDAFQWSQSETFAQALTPNFLILKSYATTYNKPLWITSTGAQWNRASWITNAISYAEANGISGLLYFDYNDGGNFQLTSSELSAFHL